MRHKSVITLPGTNKGRQSKYKGHTFRVDVLERDEVNALIEAERCGLSGLRYRALIATGFGTGGRISELLGLYPSDVDLTTGAVRLNGTKTKNAVRTVGLNPECRAVLRDWMDVRREELKPPPGSPIFCCISKWEVGNPLGSAQFRVRLKVLAERAGIDKRVHPHCLRHSFAVALYRAGVPLLVISKALGHSNIAVTNIYINHIDPTDVLNACNGLSLGNGSIQIPGMADWWAKEADLADVPVEEW